MGEGWQKKGREQSMVRERNEVKQQEGEEKRGEGRVIRTVQL